MDSDIRFYFDPTCPVSWKASTWVRQVAEEQGKTVDWRFMSLRVLNTGINYDQEFAPGVEHVHNAGVRMLRVAEHARTEKGAEAVDRLYKAFGEHIFEAQHASSGDANAALDARPDKIEAMLGAAGLPKFYVEALNDPSLETAIIKETNDAIGLLGLSGVEGRAVGTPVISRRRRGRGRARPARSARRTTRPWRSPTPS